MFQCNGAVKREFTVKKPKVLKIRPNMGIHHDEQKKNVKKREQK